MQQLNSIFEIEGNRLSGKAHPTKLNKQFLVIGLLTTFLAVFFWLWWARFSERLFEGLFWDSISATFISLMMVFFTHKSRKPWEFEINRDSKTLTLSRGIQFRSNSLEDVFFNFSSIQNFQKSLVLQVPFEPSLILSGKKESGKTTVQNEEILEELRSWLRGSQ